MDRNKLILYTRTIRHLRLKQIYYQFYYRIRNKSNKRKHVETSSVSATPLSWEDHLTSPKSYRKLNTFDFLNLQYSFESTINWNYPGYGKLWTYNLNYFDFLNQKDLDIGQGILLIKDYIKNNDSLIDGLEPYPISLRGINWIKFLSRNKIENSDINKALFQHYIILTKNIEYHLLANHLLENGFALYFGACFFKNNDFYELAKKILSSELEEQIMDDGAHFELSPMYHQILLFRLLDCINLSSLNKWTVDSLLPLLKDKAIKMLGWLEAVTYTNGNIPMVNDSTYNIAPSADELFSYAKSLNLEWNHTKLSDSGYRKLTTEKFELFCDVGNIGPTYQPGHAHSDTFNFELYFDGKPIIVDTGVSTYEKNDLRQLQRSTSSHNTVKVGDIDQSQVWGGFRVGKRAKIIALDEGSNFIEASHDGYRDIGVIHTRRFEVNGNTIIISDSIAKSSSTKQTAYLHFHPDISSIQIFDDKIKVLDHQISLDIYNATSMHQGEYEFALGFNRTKTAAVVEIQFEREMKLKIDLN